MSSPGLKCSPSEADALLANSAIGAPAHSPDKLRTLFQRMKSVGGPVKMGWSRYLMFSMWLTICTTWAFLHFIQGSRHVADQLNPDVQASNSWLPGVDSFSEFLEMRRFGGGGATWEAQAGLGEAAKGDMAQKGREAGGGVSQDGRKGAGARGRESSSKTSLVGRVGGQLDRPEEDEGHSGPHLSAQGWQSHVTAGEGAEAEGSQAGGSEGGALEKTSEAAGGTLAGGVGPLEAEEMRRMLQDVAEASESYVETPGLFRLWGSADYAGKEEEEGDKGEGDIAGGEPRETMEAPIGAEEMESEAKAEPTRMESEKEGQGGGTRSEVTAVSTRFADAEAQQGKRDRSNLSTQVRGAQDRGPDRVSQSKPKPKLAEKVAERRLPSERAADSRDAAAHREIDSEQTRVAQHHALEEEEGRLAKLQSDTGGIGKRADERKLSSFSSRRARGRSGDDDWEEAHERWAPPKKCASVEEMGAAASGDGRQASLRIRRLIQDYLEVHGAARVRTLPEEEFCQRGFVIGKGQHDGFGNNLYKILTAAGVAIMLNRSIILGEQGNKHGSSTHPEYTSQRTVLSFPFGEYVHYSPEMMSMQEAKQLWVKNGCTSRYGREFRMITESFENVTNTAMLCDDWTQWDYPVIWLAGATDAVALQWFLKSRHARMRQLATALLGRPWEPGSRPNTFGELARALLAPAPVVQQAIEWTLGEGGNPDFALHLRMMSARPHQTVAAAHLCFASVLERSGFAQRHGRKPRLAVVADMPEVLRIVEDVIGTAAEIVRFNFEAFVQAHPNLEAMSLNTFTVPKGRADDWGPLPRWVAIVDFFLAAQARFGFISGGGQRVAATYAQLAAGYAAAQRLDDSGDDGGYQLYSSFHHGVLDLGLLRQGGRAHAWHTFGGALSCPKQERQCALTPMLPYAWWDAPWQSPLGREVHNLRSMGLQITSEGAVTKNIVENFCQIEQASSTEVVTLALPHCENITVFEACYINRKKLTTR